MNIDEKAILNIAKQITFCYPKTESYWEYYSKITLEDVKSDEYGYSDYEDQIFAKEALLKVIRKCIVDNFPILDYSIFDTELGITFVNTKDYEDFHKHKIKKHIRAIFFYCPKSEKVAIPYSLDGNARYENCFEALEN